MPSLREKLKGKLARRPKQPATGGEGGGGASATAGTEIAQGNENEHPAAAAPSVSPPADGETPPTPPPPPSKPTDLWAAAGRQLAPNERRLLENLQGATRSTGPPSTPIDDLVQLTKLKQQECEQKFWTVRVGSREIVLRDVAEKVISWLDTFKEIGDVAVQFDVTSASLPWAGFRFLVQLAVSERDQMAGLLLALEKSVRIVTRCRVIELLYKPDDTGEPALANLHAALVRLYAAILRTIVRSYDLYSKNTASRAMSALFNPGQTAAMSSTLAKLEIELSLELDVCENLRKSFMDKKAQKEQQRLAELVQKLDEPLARTNENIQKLLNTVERQQHLALLEWISQIPYAKYHEEIREARVQNTCEWLLAHEKYREWVASDVSPVLWVQGSPGSGKSFLASKAIDSFRECLTDPGNPNQEGFAFFYCKRDEEKRRDPVEVARSLLRQLSCPVFERGRIHQDIVDLEHELRTNGKDFTFGICEDWIQKMVDAYPRTTIILDALDECDEGSRSRMMDILDVLLKGSSTKLKVMILSRPDSDIRDRFKRYPFIEISATDNHNDIAVFVKRAIERHPRWTKMDSQLRSEVMSVLLEKSQGMFQWAFLQVRQLLEDCKTPTAIRDRLGRLPKNLKLAYDEIYAKIKGLHAHERQLAERAFKWVLVALEPINRKDFLLAVSQDPNGGEVRYHSEVDEDLLLGLCCNLLVIDSQLDVWRFSHLSVAEYLEEHQLSANQAHLDIGRICLYWLVDKAYLSAKYAVFGSYSESFPLGCYAHRHVFEHIADRKEQADDRCLAVLLDRFLGTYEHPTQAFSHWIQQSGYRITRRRHMYQSIEGDGGIIMVHVICALGLHSVLHRWAERDLTRFKNLVTRVDALGESPLGVAAYHGHTNTCALLVELGVDPNRLVEGQRESALNMAARAGHLETVAMLLDVGAQVSPPTANPIDSPLVPAVLSGNPLVIERIVANGADPNLQIPGPYGSVLAEAATNKSASMQMQTLLKAGADVNMQLGRDSYGSALAAAASLGSTDSAASLISHGATIDLPLQWGKFGSALAAAAAYGVADTVHHLVSRGANVNMPLENGCYGSALVTAVVHRNLGCVKALLQAGADVNQQVNNRYGSALIAAVKLCGTLGDPWPEANSMIVRWLLLLGADAQCSSPSVGDRNALQVLERLREQQWLRSTPRYEDTFKEVNHLLLTVKPDREEGLELLASS